MHKAFNEFDKYLSIPQNKVVFYDFLYKNIKINYDGIEIITNFAAQYKEVLIDNQICFNAHIAHIDQLNDYFGHFVNRNQFGALCVDTL